MRQLQIAIARGLYEIGCEDEFAEVVARFRGWTGPSRNHRRRVWQALAENTDRAFDASWVLLAQRLFAYHGRTDLCDEMTGAMMRARWEGERAREESPPRKMLSVRPREARRETA